MHGARSVLVILLLAGGCLSPPSLWAQDSRAPAVRSTHGFGLEANSPDPASPETWIPFYVEESLFEQNDSVVVSMRIFNILRQVVAIPESVGSNRRRGERLINLTLRDPGQRVAYWNGRNTAGQLVPSGVYYAQLVVNDRAQTRKVVVYNPRRSRSIVPRF